MCSCLNEHDSQGQRIYTTDDVCPTLRGGFNNKSGSPSTLVFVFKQNQRDEVRILGDIAGAIVANAGIHNNNFISYPRVQRDPDNESAERKRPEVRGRMPQPVRELQTTDSGDCGTETTKYVSSYVDRTEIAYAKRSARQTARIESRDRASQRVMSSACVCMTDTNTNTGIGVDICGTLMAHSAKTQPVIMIRR